MQGPSSMGPDWPDTLPKGSPTAKRRSPPSPPAHGPSSPYPTCIEEMRQPPPPVEDTAQASAVVNSDYFPPPVEEHNQPPSPSILPPQTIPPPSRSQSRTSTLPESSAHSGQISRPLPQLPIHTPPYSQPVRPEHAQYLENAPQSPSLSITRAAQPTPVSFRLPDSPVRPTASTSPTTPCRPSRSSGGTPATSSGALQLPVSTFIFPGSRSVARPKEALNLQLPIKPWRRKGKSPEVPHDVPLSPITPTVPRDEGGIHTNVLPEFQGTTHSESSHVLSDDATDSAQACQACSTPKSSSPGYVFPSGRSLAHPKEVPRELKNKHGEKRTTFIDAVKKKTRQLSRSAEDSNTISPTGDKTRSGTRHSESQERAKPMKVRVGDYPLDPSDKYVLLKFRKLLQSPYSHKSPIM